MSWASGRQILVISIIAIVFLAIASVGAYFSLYKAPSCTDGKQNQSEGGVDCGGPCARACAADAADPDVSFVRAIRISDSRTDAVAYVANPNQSYAAKAVRYHLEFHDAAGSLLGQKDGITDLPPGATVPVYVRNAYSGVAVVAQTFLTFPEAPLWIRYEDVRTLPIVSDAHVVSGSTGAPRIVATVTNPSVRAIPATKLVVTVFDSSGTAIAASQTILPELPGEGEAQAIFTWNAAFASAPARIDVKPVVPLP